LNYTPKTLEVQTSTEITSGGMGIKIVKYTLSKMLLTYKSDVPILLARPKNKKWHKTHIVCISQIMTCSSQKPFKMNNLICRDISVIVTIDIPRISETTNRILNCK
jgi:hypothetical protein